MKQYSEDANICGLDTDEDYNPNPKKPCKNGKKGSKSSGIGNIFAADDSSAECTCEEHKEHEHKEHKEHEEHEHKEHKEHKEKEHKKEEHEHQEHKEHENEK